MQNYFEPTGFTVRRYAWTGAFEVETGFGPETDERMHRLLVITEPGNNKSADALIIAAVQNGKISSRAAQNLPPNLLSDDGTIPVDFCKAIQAAVQFHYLAVKGVEVPRLTPGTDFLTPAPR